MIEVPKYERVITLGVDSAIDTIRGEACVYLRKGVWNRYELVEVEDVIKSIKGSSYGADVYYCESKAMYYVSIPNTSDMW